MNESCLVHKHAIVVSIKDTVCECERRVCCSTNAKHLLI